ncbi:putative protein FAM10A4 [Folsomia candida]|uniref:putative protein FAM10A4 n=1 Tax=Folsomia candida TaxID=158441 RepID=UPI000B8FA61A|nr:putative protein FAM10A4 [Folsomia candida]
MSTSSIDPAMLATVKEFVELLKHQPSLIFTEDLKFLRDYLSAVGAKLPKMPEPGNKSGSGDSKPSGGEPKKPTAKPTVEEVIDDEMEIEEEPFPELPQEGVVDADEVDSNQDMGSNAEDVGEEAMEKSNELKMEAVGLFGEGKFEECIQKYTEAIKLNGHAAVLFAKRGQAYLRLEKPNACIKDCSKALELNPDSAIGYKFRGRAHRLLGHWEEAASDLRQACKIDFDEQTDEWLKECQPNARKVEEWRIRKKLRDEERDIQQRKARAQERARAHAASAEAHHQQEQDSEGPDSDFLGGLGGILGDPEIAGLMNDPEVAEAFKDIGQNPANLLKYQNNPKVMKFIQAFQKKMGGMGGMPGMGGGMPGMGGMPGGMPGFPGGMGGFPGMPGFGGASAPPPPNPTPNMKPPGDDLD